MAPVLGSNDALTAHGRAQFIQVEFKMPGRRPGGVIKDTFLGQEREKSPVKVTKEMCCSG